MNILLVGIQGSGKGTQARKIATDYGYSFFEMGQKLRNFSELDHPRSEEVKACMEQGKLVPDELITAMLEHYRDTHGSDKILFDGIPRSSSQKALFDAVFPDYFVVFLDLKREQAIERLAGRKIDPTTGESFQADFEGSFSPFTGQKLIKRPDDTPEAVAKRIEIFYENTLPLLANWAQEEKRVYTIDASRDVETVYEQIKVVLSAY
ncbi:MAG: nucleoside monophosphate kinase [Candidatus Gracilibacteria bacterium]|nr:nucleoside monophosphate kinase [Candidatus Gracilibacteria bacterium]